MTSEINSPGAYVMPAGAFGLIAPGDKFSQAFLSLTTHKESFIMPGGCKMTLQVGKAAIRVRWGSGKVTVVTASGGTYPTGFVGTETFSFTVEGTSVAGTFPATAQTVDQVVAYINSVAATAGFPGAGPKAFAANAGGQLQLRGTIAGAAGTIVVNAGTGNTTLGLSAATSHGTGAPTAIATDFYLPAGASYSWVSQTATTDVISVLSDSGTAEVYLWQSDTSPN